MALRTLASPARRPVPDRTEWDSSSGRPTARTVRSPRRELVMSPRPLARATAPMPSGPGPVTGRLETEPTSARAEAPRSGPRAARRGLAQARRARASAPTERPLRAPAAKALVPPPALAERLVFALPERVRAWPPVARLAGRLLRAVVARASPAARHAERLLPALAQEVRAPRPAGSLLARLAALQPSVPAAGPLASAPESLRARAAARPAAAPRWARVWLLLLEPATSAPGSLRAPGTRPTLRLPPRRAQAMDAPRSAPVSPTAHQHRPSRRARPSWPWGPRDPEPVSLRSWTTGTWPSEPLSRAAQGSRPVRSSARARRAAPRPPRREPRRSKATAGVSTRRAHGASWRA